MIAESILHPFDTVSLRLKVQQNAKYLNCRHTWSTMFREEGLRGYFGGLGTTLIAAPIGNALYFGSYEFAKTRLFALQSSESAQLWPSAVYFIAGGFGELVSSLVNVPLEVIKCRLQLGKNPAQATGGWSSQTQNYRHSLHALTRIAEHEGLKGLYAGFRACVAVDVTFSAFSFLFFENLKATTRRDVGHVDFSLLELLVMGSISGAGAAFLTNPLDVVCVRQMTRESSPQGGRIGHELQQIWTQDGLRGFWRGTIPRMMHIVPSTGLCFALYELIKVYIFHGELKEFSFDG